MIDSEIFGQNQALEKPPQGKLVRERERFYYASGKKSDIHLQSKTNLSQPSKMTQQAASISVQGYLIFCVSPSRKMCLKNLTNSDLDFCAKQQLMLPSISMQTITKIRTVRTAINAIVLHLKNYTCN